MVALVVVVPRVMLSACVTDFGADGGYYTDIAQNLRDGNGLTTDLSVFHQGFPSFPFPTPVYPLWPLVYGLAASLGPIERVGVWLPTALYFVVVALAYRLGKRLAPRLDLGASFPIPGLTGLHGGHIFALTTALTSEFARATARPYTEGLAFTLLFGLFLRAPRLWSRLGLVAGLEMGAWLAALFFTRSQLVVVAIAAVLGLGFAVLRRPREASTFFLGSVVVAAAAWRAYLAWAGTFLPNPSLTTYLRFDLARVESNLSAIPVMVQTTGPLDRLLDLASSFPIAFSLYESGYTYFNLHAALIHAVPLALVVLVARYRRLPALLRFARSPAGPNAVFFTSAAIGLLLSLHTVHKVYGASWVFGGRHAIPTLFIVANAVLFLLRARGATRAAGIAVLLAGTYGMWRGLALSANNQCINAQTSPDLVAYRAPIRGFLLSEHARLGGLTVAVERPEAQRLAWRTPDVGFHWLTDTTSVDDLSVLVRELDVAYVVDFEEVGYLGAIRDPAFSRYFALYVVFDERGAGEDEDAATTGRARRTRVYAPRCTSFPEVETCDPRPPPPPAVAEKEPAL